MISSRSSARQGFSTSMSGSGRRNFDVNLIGMNRALAAVEPLLRPVTVAVQFASMSGYRCLNVQISSGSWITRDVLVDGGMMAVLPEDATGGAANPDLSDARN